MALKCAICKGKIETGFLGKIKGTYVKGKPVCDKCQKKFGEKLEEQI